MTLRRALLIGIDEYRNFSSLEGCVNDIDALEPLLTRNESGSPNFECVKRTSSTGGVARDDLLDAMDGLLSGGADVALLYFAGHGVAATADVHLVTEDGSTATPGVAFSEVLAKIHGSPVSEVVLLLDCCFAGGAGGIPQLGASAAALRIGTSVLAASRGDQTAAETAAGRGLFSTYVGGGLAGGAADVLGKVTVAGLYSYLDESFGAWDQRPMFKANVDRLHVLRVCDPAVPLDELREITTLFHEADFVLPLDPSFEPDSAEPDPANTKIFGVLQRFRAAKLVEPVGADHMYYAAMESKSCRLTPLGKHYWHVSSAGKV